MRTARSLRQRAPELLERYEFAEASKKAFSQNGYFFRTEDGDEFILFARRHKYEAGGLEREEVKLDVFFVEEGKPRHAGFMDRTNFHWDGGRKESHGHEPIRWEISDRAPEWQKDAEMSRNTNEAMIVFSEFSSKKGRFKGIASMMRGFEDEYSRASGVTTLFSHGTSDDAEKMLRCFYGKAGGRVERAYGFDVYSLVIDISKAEIPKPRIVRLPRHLG